METKKDPKVDISKKRGLLLNISLTTSLLLVTIAFEWRTYDAGPGDLGALEDEFEEQLEVPLTAQPPPPPPPPIIPPEILEVPDEEEVEEEIEIDVEITEDMVIEEVTFEDEPEEDIDHIFEVVEEQATPIGGQQALKKYLRRALKYPSQAIRMGLEGRVYLQFVVERNGTISNVKVIRGIGGGCDEAAVEALKKCPIKWNPAKQRGKPVRTYFTQPVTFTLSK